MILYFTFLKNKVNSSLNDTVVIELALYVFFVLFECFLLFLADSAFYPTRPSRCPYLYHGPYLYPLLYYFVFLRANPFDFIRKMVRSVKYEKSASWSDHSNTNKPLRTFHFSHVFALRTHFVDFARVVCSRLNSHCESGNNMVHSFSKTGMLRSFFLCRLWGGDLSPNPPLHSPMSTKCVHISTSCMYTLGNK